MKRVAVRNRFIVKTNKRASIDGIFGQREWRRDWTIGCLKTIARGLDGVFAGVTKTNASSPPPPDSLNSSPVLPKENGGVNDVIRQGERNHRFSHTKRLKNDPYSRLR
jgi:hypothetical protein